MRVVLRSAVTGALLATVAVAASCCGNALVLTPGDTEVVIAPDAPKTVLFAVEELTNLLAQAYGCAVPVVTSPTPGKKGVYLGDSQWTRAAGIDVAALKRDAFTIVADGRGVYIAGRDDPKEDTHHSVYSPHTGVWAQYHEHATLFGVYEFLERYAGVRMYFPGELGTIVPRTAGLKVPPARFTVAPDFIVRNYSAFSDGILPDGSNTTLHPLRKLNYQRNRMQTQYIPCCHGSNGFRIQRRFAKEHPEYMLLFEKGGKLVRDVDPQEKHHHPGQLCHSSKVYDEIFKDICSYAKGDPPDVRGMGSWRDGNKKQDWAVATFRKPWVDIMPQDGFVPCQCEKCQAAYKKGEQHYATELIWGRTVEMANRLKQAGVDIRITQMAYTPYRRIPEIAIPDNVDVMVAESGPWSVSNPKGLETQYAEIRGWREKLGRPVWIWTYPNKYGQMQLPNIPNGTPRAWAKYYKDVAPWIFGVYAESENDRFLYNALCYYVLGKVCWNVKVDVDALLEEFHRLMFGAAAKPMAALFDAVERKWVDEVAGRLVDTDLGPVRQPPSPYELFTRVYSPETLAQWDAWLKEAASLVAQDSLEARRIALYRREFYEPLAKAASEYIATISVEAELKRRAESGRKSILVNGDFTAPKCGSSKRHFGYYKDKRGYGWLGGWICGDGDVPHISFVDDVPPGAKGRAIRLSMEGSPKTVQISNHFLPTSGRYKAGMKYRISYFVRLHNVVSGGKGGGVGVRVWCDHNQWFPKNRLTGSTGWIHQEFYFTAGEKSANFDSQFTIYLWNATGSVDYADLRIEPCE